MRTVPLHGKRGVRAVALVDDEDYELVSDYNWHIHYGKTAIYAAGQPRGAPHNAKQIFMHNLIMGVIGVDHANHDGLDNQRSNLRPATKAQNMRNTLKRRNTKNRFKGVRQRRHTFQARIRLGERYVNLGHFTSEEEAARAYDAAAREHYGEFACLNFPEPCEYGARAS